LAFFAKLHLFLQMPGTRSSTRRLPASRSRTVPPVYSLRRERTSKRRGELAELVFLLVATRMGFAVSKPYGDSERYDFILDPHESDCHPEEGDLCLTKDRGVPCEASRCLRGKSARPARIPCHPHEAAVCPTKGLDVPCTLVCHPEESAVCRTNDPHSPNCHSERRRSFARRTIVAVEEPAFSRPLLWRVQVKASTQLLNGLYRINAHRRSGRRAVPYRPGEIDFIAAYIIPEDTWYIIPIHAVRGTSLLFRRKNDRRPGLYDQYKEAWHLLRPKL
jgi:hypothetical protein